MDKQYLPLGRHWGLTVTHDRLEDAGPFTGGGHKLIWHTTEGSSAEGAFSAVRVKRAAPHVIVNPVTGRVLQCIPFDHAARALMHSGGPETNRANCIQIEVVGFSEGRKQDHPKVAEFSEREWRHLAALAVLIEHRVEVPRRARHSFTAPKRLTPTGFVRAAGHLGHCHVPGNDHTDPGPHFNAHHLFSYMGKVSAENS